jgi:hypothetical protein
MKTTVYADLFIITPTLSLRVLLISRGSGRSEHSHWQALTTAWMEEVVRQSLALLKVQSCQGARLRRMAGTSLFPAFLAGAANCSRQLNIVIMNWNKKGRGEPLPNTQDLLIADF